MRVQGERYNQKDGGIKGRTLCQTLSKPFEASKVTAKSFTKIAKSGWSRVTWKVKITISTLFAETVLANREKLEAIDAEEVSCQE